VKSVLVEFSSGVSTCPNEGPQSDLGALFYQGPTIVVVEALTPALGHNFNIKHSQSTRVNGRQTLNVFLC